MSDMMIPRLKQLKPGQSVVYFATTGTTYPWSLAEACEPGRVMCDEYRKLRDTAWELYEAKRIALSQRRLPGGATEYTATGL